MNINMVTRAQPVSRSMRMDDKIPDPALYWRGFPSGVSYFSAKEFRNLAPGYTQYLTFDLKDGRFQLHTTDINGTMRTDIFFDVQTGIIRLQVTGRGNPITDILLRPPLNQKEAEEYIKLLTELKKVAQDMINSGKSELQNTADYLEFVIRSVREKFPTSVNSGQIALNIKLGTNYPNPVSTSANIPFETLEKAFVRIKITDIMGRTVAVVFEGDKPAGQHSVSFNRGDISAGTYYVVMETEGIRISKPIQIR